MLQNLFITLKRQKTHRIIYIVLLFALAISMTTSTYVTNMCWVFLLVNWVLEWNWQGKFRNFRGNYLLQAFLALTAAVVAGLFWSHNLVYGIDYMRRFLPVIVLPLVILTTPPLKGNHVRRLLMVYVATIFVVTIIGLVRYLSHPSLPYREIVPCISHIRFALNLCFAICILLGWAFEPAYNYYAKKAQQGGLVAHKTPADMLRSLQASFAVMGRRHFDWISIVCMLAVAWFVAFLLLIQSYTAFVILFVTAIVMLMVYWRRIYAKPVKWTMLSLWLAVAATMTLTVVGNMKSYYRLSPLALAPLAEKTAGGRPFEHACDGIIESGNYVNNYVCKEELCNEWNRRSKLPADSISDNGYPYYSILIRYLNAKGLTKDSVGVWQLTDADVRQVEQGVENPAYTQHGIKRMIYVMLFEKENYCKAHAVSGFSTLQRFELWKAGWQAFRQHPLFGTGTGDVVDALHHQLQQQGSVLVTTSKHTHSQYLTWLITFGILGFSIIAFFFVRAFVRHRMFQPPLLMANICIILISFVSEDTLETLAGGVFCTLFLCLFLASARAKEQ